MKKAISLFFVATLLCVGFTACGDDDADVKLPDISVNFGASELGLDADAESVDATLNLSRAHGAAIDVVVGVTPNGVVYGDQFTTTPAVQDDQIKVTVPAGSTSASFSIARVKDVLLEGTESVNFTIKSLSVTEGFAIGEKKDLKLSFDAIVSGGQQMTLQGRSGTVAYANSVYVDFSTNTQISIDRKSWSLGFYCGDNFRVFLNPSMQMAAAATTKTDLSAVTSADLAGLPTLVASMMEAKFIGLENVDDLKGDLTKTAFSEISATEAENKVYVVVTEDTEDSAKKTYYKVKVQRNNAGYKVEYALLDGTEVNTVEVAKDAAYNLVGMSFKDKKTVVVEPKAKNWDIEWAYGTGVTTYEGTDYAYFMQDLVLINSLGGIQTIEVLTSTVSYADCSKSNVSSLTFSNVRNTIGTNWRSTMPATGVKTDRFYVIKDPAGNYYKLRFLKMGVNDDAVRGNPIIEYALLK